MCALFIKAILKLTAARIDHYFKSVVEPTGVDYASLHAQRSDQFNLKNLMSYEINTYNDLHIPISFTPEAALYNYKIIIPVSKALFFECHQL